MADTPVVDPVDTETILFDVDGMTCATCALSIERVLDRQEGVDALRLKRFKPYFA